MGSQRALIENLLGNLARGHRDRAGRSRDVLIGLLGRGISGSRSPRMHEREGERLGLHYTYVLIDFDSLMLGDDALSDVVAAAAALGFAGLNVTHPFKRSVIEHLTVLSPEATAIGAVNTVVFEQHRRVGHNTDAWGFAESVRTGLAGAPLDTVILFGAGGGGAAVAYALLGLGVHLLDLYDADSQRATQMADRLSERFGRTVVAVSDPVAAIKRASGTVNATPVGMDKYPGVPFPAEILKAHQWVADIVYFPAETELLKRARALGCRTLSGTGMAIFQAIKSFELFTGLTPDHAAMAQHFEAAA